MAGIAQLVEQRTQNLPVTGSNPLLKIRLMCRKGNGRYSSVSRAEDSKSSCYRFKSAMKINKDNVSEMAGIAQLVQQRTQNPRITGSNPLLTISLMCRKGNGRYRSVIS